MFQRIWSKSPVNGREIFRAALLASLAAGTWMAGAVDAEAQIRSGRSERPLYHSQIEQEEMAEVPVPRPRPTRARTTGLRTVANGPARSIVERAQQADADAAESEPVAPKAQSAPMVPAPSVPAPSQARMAPTPDPLPMDDNMSTFDEGYAEPSHGGCSCGQCGSGGGYCSDLAPGCYGNFGSNDPCGGPLSRMLGNLSIRGEVPIYWRRGIALPPLVTTGPLNNATTTVLLGNEKATEDAQAGVRLTVGTWFDPQHYRGVIFRYGNAGNQSTDFNFDSNTNPTLARPINNITSGTSTPDTQLIASPGDRTGSVHVSTKSEVDGFDIVLRRLAYRDRFTRVDWLMGYQHNRIEESLNINSSTLVTGNVPPLTGTSIAVSDRITTHNSFNGAVIGLMSTRQFAYWKFEAMGRMGLGSLQRKYSASGTTTTTSAGGVTSTDDQGLLVRNTNNQTRVNDTFVVAPEVGFNAGYMLTRNLDFSVGYNYLLIGKVAQPGRQIDSTVNLSDPLSGALRPGFTLATQQYWVHSLNLGMQWRY